MSYIDPVILAELEELNGKEIKPAEGGQKPKIEDMPEGTYDFEVVSGEFRKIENGSILFQFTIKILGGNNDGVICTVSPFWLKSADGSWDEKKVASLKADLITLGFDADQWEGDRTFAKEMAKVMSKLKGIKARGIRKNNPYKGKVYNNFNMSTKLPANYIPTVAKAPKFDFGETAAKGEEIPF
jgi:hypothetical protein